jgi:diamine N-acetyltransferase
VPDGGCVAVVRWHTRLADWRWQAYLDPDEVLKSEGGMKIGSFNGGLRLRPTMLSDLDFVLGVERDAANLPFITPWERTQHEGAVRFPDFRHFIVEAGTGTQATGFVILQGCRSPHRAVELKRIVLQAKGQGLGRACVRVLKQMAFRDLRAHRFWLDVKSRNLRAQHL